MDRSLSTLLLGTFATLGAFSADLASEVGWELQVTSLAQEVPRTCYQVEQMPVFARGAFFISGPAKFEMGSVRFNAIFDGYGRINRFEIHEHEVCYTSVWLNTSYYQEAKKLGTIPAGVLFEDTTPERTPCPITHPICDLTHSKSDNNWVNLLPFGDKGLLITDTPIMIQIDLDTLAVSGTYPWKDGVDSPSWVEPHHEAILGSAHPVLLPKTESTYIEIIGELATLPWEKATTAIYSIDAKLASRKLIANVSMPDMTPNYIHAFGVTEHHVVLPLNLGLGMPGITKGRPYLMHAITPKWNGIKVINLTDGQARHFDTEPFVHVHIANTFENETGLVMDLGAYTSNPFARSPAMDIDEFLNKTSRDTRVAKSEFRRLHLHLAGPSAGQITFEAFSVPGRTSDFFKINPSRNGLHYCIYYAVEWYHDDKAYASMAVLKQNLCTGTRTYWARPNFYPSEPFFVPGASGGEDDGVVFFVTLDGNRRASSFVTLDARSFKEIAVVELPSHIPFLAHGQFIPKAARDVASIMSSAIARGDDASLAASSAINTVLI